MFYHKNAVRTVAITEFSRTLSVLSSTLVSEDEAMATDTKTRDIISLKGSAQLVQEFFCKLIMFRIIVILKFTSLDVNTLAASLLSSLDVNTITASLLS